MQVKYEMKKVTNTVNLRCTISIQEYHIQYTERGITHQVLNNKSQQLSTNINIHRPNISHWSWMKLVSLFSLNKTYEKAKSKSGVHLEAGIGFLRDCPIQQLLTAEKHNSSLTRSLHFSSLNVILTSSCVMFILKISWLLQAFSRNIDKFQERILSGSLQVQHSSWSSPNPIKTPSSQLRDPHCLSHKENYPINNGADKDQSFQIVLCIGTQTLFEFTMCHKLIWCQWNIDRKYMRLV